MPLEDYKIGEFTYPVVDMDNQPSQAGLTAQQIKEWFDSNTNEIKQKVNALIDALSADGGGELIGSANIRAIRLNANNELEISADGVTFSAVPFDGHVIVDTNGTVYTQRKRLMVAGEIEDTGTETFLHGIPGPQGERGPAGETGSQGIQGPRGKAYMPSVSPAGILSWTLTETDTVPASANIRGPQGERGPAGQTGQQGAQGVPGVQGVPGPRGPAGPAGATGPAGPAGQDGQDGQDGAPGPQGPRGKMYLPSVTNGIISWTLTETETIPQSADITGPAGPAGPAGQDGQDGQDGAPGPNLINASTETTINGLLKGNGSVVSAAVSGTDYQAPLTAGTDYQTPLPAQTGQSGKFLTTNGTELSWGTPSGGGSDSTFKCTYGTTVSADIEAALSAEKLIYCIYNNRLYTFGYRNSATDHYFYAWQGETKYYIRCNNGSWSNSSAGMAKTASPTFTGAPKSTTAAAGTDTTQIATTAFVMNAIGDIDAALEAML